MNNYLHQHDNYLYYFTLNIHIISKQKIKAIFFDSIYHLKLIYFFLEICFPVFSQFSCRLLSLGFIIL
jgi:hypothetical protein